MMDWTDRYCRYFHRCLSSEALLYSEMLTTGAVIHGDRDHLLGFDSAEGKVVLQLGGSDAAAMAQAAKIGEEFGYAQINMNVGCPSDRVQSGRFGACLMAEPEIVADCVAAMLAAVRIPVTVKCRIGIDRDDSFEPFATFVEKIKVTGCDTFIVHARKAWLDGLSPKENRDVPPLKYEYVQRIKRELPDIRFILNGGLETHEQAISLLSGSLDPQSSSVKLDGAMLGRAAYKNPWLLQQVDELYYGRPAAERSRADVVNEMLPYIESKVDEGVSLGRITRHMLGLFLGQPGGRIWRRHLSENAWRKNAGISVVTDALDKVTIAATKVAA
ncbi:tRNA dihydrouridine(20/20a) synthase DusA [Chromatiales bacterium (ex Bugula neritina AB1)]|nr:tRNA dihydrouridine(20/20a) synthase DusA [Chromatiales bacterium (ex Bugula neritina AB1)]